MLILVTAGGAAIHRGAAQMRSGMAMATRVPPPGAL